MSPDDPEFSSLPVVFTRKLQARRAGDSIVAPYLLVYPFVWQWCVPELADSPDVELRLLASTMQDAYVVTGNQTTKTYSRALSNRRYIGEPGCARTRIENNN